MVEKVRQLLGDRRVARRGARWPARRGGVRFRWGLVPCAVIAVAAASVLGAPAASAAGTPTITVEYDATSVTAQGLAQPSVIVRGTGFVAAPAGQSVKVISANNETAASSTFRFGYDTESTLESKRCTHTVPSYCFVQYEGGELRPFRLFLGDGSPGRGRTAACGDWIRVTALDSLLGGPTTTSNAVRFRMPCDTYTPRPPRPIL